MTRVMDGVYKTHERKKMFGVLQRTGTWALYYPEVPGPGAGGHGQPQGQGTLAVFISLLLDSSFSKGTAFGGTEGV